ncbi:hypothetical protein GA0074695_1510 [Micromonospora viridifaciens]|uniref:Signal transduction histidine kinase n=1 Tax=Micromonospora viridifaciens TaxID=1881 RepID=A0A1C4VJ98_MICVI|nr:hypothetical protein [Micromonospora viridifaciens]SCE83875.1 hypothetical protein GA0074695_1510 [Micromonospora viridifaciens]
MATDLGETLDDVERLPAPAVTAPPGDGTAPAGGAPEHARTEAADRTEAAGRAASAVASASDRAARIGVVTIALAWHLAIDLPALLGAGSAPIARAVIAAGWLVTAVVGVAAGVRLLRGGLPSAWRLAAVLLVVDAAVFAAAGGGQLFAAVNWAWGGLVWFFLLVLWRRPVGWLLALLGAHAAIALAAVVVFDATAPADLARYAMYVYGTSSLPVAVFVGGTALAALARDRADTAAATAAVETARVAAEQARAERQARLGLVSGAAEEVLAALAAGDADPADPEVRRRCVLAAARLRRLIAESDDVPDPLLHELRAAADLAERNGLPIELVAVGVPPDLPVEVRRRLADPLTAALADARGWARLTVVAGPDEVVASLVTPDHDGPGTTGPPGATGPPDTAGDGNGPVELGHERDGEIRWTQTRWRRP